MSGARSQFSSEGKHKGQSCRQRSDSTALVPALRCYCDKRWVMLSRDSGFSLPRPHSPSFPSSSFSPFLFIKEKVFSVCWLNRYIQEASTVMNHFATGIPSEKSMLGQFQCYVNVIECTYTSLDGPTHCTPQLCGTACHSQATGLHGTLLHKTTRDVIKHKRNDAIEKRGQRGMCEATASIT